MVISKRFSITFECNDLADFLWIYRIKGKTLLNFRLNFKLNFWLTFWLSSRVWNRDTEKHLMNPPNGQMLLTVSYRRWAESNLPNLAKLISHAVWLCGRALSLIFIRPLSLAKILSNWIRTVGAFESFANSILVSFIFHRKTFSKFAARLTLRLTLLVFTVSQWNFCG